jgi:hypothetical protein
MSRKYSSARDYYGSEGLLEIIRLDNLITRCTLEAQISSPTKAMLHICQVGAS